MFEQRTLFEDDAQLPLAARLRPQTLEEFCGQTHLLGEGKVLRRLIESDKIGSMIFWGPPGVGKTTLARIIAQRTRANFIDFSAVTSGIREIRQVMEQAEKSRRFGEKTILFVDEIHRFNKAQQDAFLPYVEKGSITLICATTENPSFEVNGALLSRCKVFVLQALRTQELTGLLNRALTDSRGFGGQRIEISQELLEAMARFANGDARSALSTLEMVVLNGEQTADTTRVTKETVEQCISKKSLLYDKAGEEHYNLISALHKSMRNSDPDAAVYWLARMLEAGEDPLYIARRVARFASEDVGLADPRALQIAVAAYQACHAVCKRRYRACRSARIGDCRCGLSGMPFYRYAGMLGASDAGGRLYVGRAQVKRPLRRLRDGEEGRAHHARRARSACDPQRAHKVDEGARIRKRI